MAKSEEQIISELNVVRETFGGGAKLPGARTAYLASPWFDDTQAELLLASYKQLLQNPTISYIHVPLLHQYKGMVLSGGNSNLSEDEKFEWAWMTYSSDVNAIKNSDLVVALETPDDVDSGSSVEIGIGIGMHKPVVGLFHGDLDKTPVNLMESFGVTSYVTEPEELKNFNFLSIATRRFEGAII